MDINIHLREMAERHFRPSQEAAGEGLAAALAAAEAKANDDKTARLKALRLERDGAVRPEHAKPMRMPATKRIVRR